MTVFELPTQPNFPWYIFKASLATVIYTLRLRYNPRMSRWILDIADASNSDILNGVPVLINRNLNGQYVISGLPSGFLFATDNTNQNTEATLNSFSLDHSIFFADETT